MRNQYCGLVSEAHIDQTVTLCGWVDRRRDHGGVIFIDLRDRDGIVQVVFDPDGEENFALADKVRSEYVLCVTGKVRARDAATVNENMATGKIEVYGTELEILLKGLKADTLIMIGGHTDVCVHYTFVDGHQHDYFCRVVEDCVAGSSQAAHDAALAAMEYLQTGAVRTTAEIIAGFDTFASQTSGERHD